jgi:hypothetical protein
LDYWVLGEGREETYHVIASGLVDGEVGDADHGDEDKRCDPVHLRRAKRGPGESEEADRFEEDKPQEADHAALGLDAVLAARELHLLAVVDVEGDEEDAGEDVSDEEPVGLLVLCACVTLEGSEMTYGMKLRPTCEGVKFHCPRTRAKLSRPVKIRASLKPLSKDRKATTGSVRRKR